MRSARFKKHSFIQNPLPHIIKPKLRPFLARQFLLDPDLGLGIPFVDARFGSGLVHDLTSFRNQVISNGNKAVGIGCEVMLNGNRTAQIGYEVMVNGYKTVGIGYRVMLNGNRTALIGYTVMLNGNKIVGIGYTVILFGCRSISSEVDGNEVVLEAISAH